MVLVGLFFCVEKLQESMGDMELWEKNNRVGKKNFILGEYEKEKAYNVTYDDIGYT